MILFKCHMLLSIRSLATGSDSVCTAYSHHMYTHLDAHLLDEIGFVMSNFYSAHISVVRG